MSTCSDLTFLKARPGANQTFENCKSTNLTLSSSAENRVIVKEVEGDVELTLNEEAGFMAQLIDENASLEVDVKEGGSFALCENGFIHDGKATFICWAMVLRRGRRRDWCVIKTR